MKIRSFAVIDTNVFVSAMISRSGYPFDILRLVHLGNVIPLFDQRILNEYFQVFHYEKLKIDNRIIQETLNIVVKNGICINNVEQTKREMQDRDDIPFFEVKENTEDLGSVLVTGNVRHFPDDKYVMTPKEYCVLLEQMDRFLSKDAEYEKTVQNIVEEIRNSANVLDAESMLKELYKGCENRYEIRPGNRTR